MTAQIFDLAAERAKRAVPAKAPSAPPQWRLSKRGNPYMTVEGYHIVVFKRGGSWAFRIELIDADQQWYSERTYADRGRGAVRCIVGGPASRTVAAAGLRFAELAPIEPRGNPWTRIGRAHIVIFPSRRTEGEWCLRLQYDNSPGRFLRRTWPLAEEAQSWVEANAHTVSR